MTQGFTPPKERSTARLLAAAMLLGLVATGCSSQRIAARSLSPEYRARPGAGMQRVRLGGLAAASAPTNAIGPEDLLEVTVATGLASEEPMVHQARVGRDGTIETPLIGRVVVAGMEAAQASAQVAAAGVQRGVFMRPQVSVTVIEQATHQVTVLGAVGEPGVKELPRGGCDVLSAIAAAGGLTDSAGVVVELLRADSLALADAPPKAGDGVQQVSFQAPAAPAAPRAEIINLADPAATAQGRLGLGDRDVLVVRPKEQRVVHVTGLVESPDQFELMHEHDLRVLDAIAMAGGPSTPIADKVLVVRQLPNQAEPLVVTVSISRAKEDGTENLILQAGDLISVESTPTTVAFDTFKSLFRLTMGVGGNLSIF